MVADNPIIPFIRGDGTGVDIWPATQKVLDAAVAKAYGGSKSIEWFKVYAGDEACDLYGTYQYLPEDTLEAIRTYGVAIKGPLTTPVGGGIRSLNVALRQIFDLYSCVRPCRYYEGTPSPHKRPQDLDVIVYRENTEDIYMGVEWEADDAVGQELRKHLNEVVIPANGKLGKRQIPEGSGIGIKPVSKHGSQRHIRKAIQHALRLEGSKRHVTLVHKGNIMKFTEGAFRDWGYELATTEFRDVCITERESWILGNLEKDPEPERAGQRPHDRAGLRQPHPGEEGRHRCRSAGGDRCHRQQPWGRQVESRWCWWMTASPTASSSRSRPGRRSIRSWPPSTSTATTSPMPPRPWWAAWAWPPAPTSARTAAIFEATHGTAPKHAGLDRINPGSVILSGVMMLEFLGWQEAADLVTKGISAAIADKQVTYDLARLMEPQVDPVSCSGFADAIISHF